ncbi:hypothetical protein D7I43_25045 [Micromonospora globbae]|uniref:Uncharacterized protein n=1 Tax=Micromonospora globbae TaxID=1894969 RepID=A0A420EVA8_9ACTN|nr:hypothetical protein D7I43_25045 [Micromonospora globbae]
MLPHSAVFQMPRTACRSGSPLRVITMVMPCQIRPQTSSRIVIGSMKPRSCCAGPSALLQWATQSEAHRPGSEPVVGHRLFDGMSVQLVSSRATHSMASFTAPARPSRTMFTSESRTASGALIPSTMTPVQVAGTNGLQNGTRITRLR